MSPRRQHRYRLLLDEMLPKRERFSELNGDYDVVHVVHNLKLAGLADERVAELAKQQGRIVVTKNYRHFGPLCKSKRVDYVVVMENMVFEEMDRLVCAYLRQRKIHKMTGRVKKIAKPPRR